MISSLQYREAVVFTFFLFHAFNTTIVEDTTLPEEK